MYQWMNENSAALAVALSEDAGAPELRSPLTSGIRAQGWLRKLLKKKNG